MPVPASPDCRFASVDGEAMALALALECRFLRADALLLRLWGPVKCEEVAQFYNPQGIGGVARRPARSAGAGDLKVVAVTHGPGGGERPLVPYMSKHYSTEKII